MISIFILKSNIRGMRYGMGTYIHELTQSLLTDENVKIYIINYPSTIYKELTLEESGSRLTKIYIPAPLTDLTNDTQNQKYANRIVDFLSGLIKQNPQSLLLVNYEDGIFIAKQIKKKFSIPVVSVIHSAQWQLLFEGNKTKFNELLPRIKESAKEIFQPLFHERELYEISDKIISVTKYMKEFITDYYNIAEEKIEVIKNGIYPGYFKNISEEEKEALKQRFGFSRNEKILLFSGRIDPNKGINFLTDAFTVVNKKHPDTRLVIVGNDTEYKRISQNLQHCSSVWGKITFTGLVEYKTMLQLYQITDIGIIPSVYDHCPYVALEMIGHNIPLVISNTEGLNEMFEKDQCIMVDITLDAEGNITINRDVLAHSILLLLDDQNLISKITSDYAKLITTKYSASEMGNKTLNVLMSQFKSIPIS